jgi:GcrA cell cycle regulator
MNEDTKNLDISALDISATVPAAAPLADASNFIGPLPLAPLQAFGLEALDADAEAAEAAESTQIRRGRKKLITTLHLNSRTCRWPIGDPVQPNFHYCGDLPVAGRNYCQKHESMSFQSSSRRRSS